MNEESAESPENVSGESASGSEGRPGPTPRFDGKPLSVSVEQRTRDWLQEYADDKGVSLAQAARWALERGIGALQAEWYLEIERSAELRRVAGIA